MTDFPKVSSILDGTLTVVDRELRRSIVMGYAITNAVVKALHDEYREIKNPSAVSADYIAWCARFDRAIIFLKDNFPPECLVTALLQAKLRGFNLSGQYTPVSSDIMDGIMVGITNEPSLAEIEDILVKMSDDGLTGPNA